MTRHRRQRGLTETQNHLLELLVLAYDRDVPVMIRTLTAWKGSHVTASRTVAAGLVGRDLAYYSAGGGFLLVTEAGRALIAEEVTA